MKSLFDSAVEMNSFDSNNKYPAVNSSSFVPSPKTDVKSGEDDLDLTVDQHDIQKNESSYSLIKNGNVNTKKNIDSATIEHNVEGKVIAHYNAENTIENIPCNDSFINILRTQVDAENIQARNDQVFSNSDKTTTKIPSSYAKDSPKILFQKIDNSVLSLPREITVLDEGSYSDKKGSQFRKTTHGIEVKEMEKELSISTKMSVNSKTESLELLESILSGDDGSSINNEVDKEFSRRFLTPLNDGVLFNNSGSKPGKTFHSTDCLAKTTEKQIKQRNGLEKEKLRATELNNLIKQTLKSRSEKMMDNSKPAKDIKSVNELRLSDQLSIDNKDQSFLGSDLSSNVDTKVNSSELQSNNYHLNSTGDTERDRISDELVLLSEMFPDIPLKHISIVLQDTHDDIEAASEQLLNYDFIRNSIPLEEPKLDSGYLVNDKSKKDTQNRKEQEVEIEELIEIFNKQDDILDILEIEDRYRDLVAWYLEQNNFKIPPTVYDILQNFSPSKPAEKQPRVDFSLTFLNSIGSSSSSASLSSSSISSDISRQSLSQVLRYNVSRNGSKQINDYHWHELMEFVSCNEQLNLPRNFYANALKWFDNDVDKVLYVGTKLSIILNEKENKKRSHKRGFKLDTRDLVKGEDKFTISSCKKHYDDKIFNKSEKRELNSAPISPTVPFRVSYDKLAKDAKNIRTDMVSCRIKEASFFYQDSARVKTEQINDLLETNTQKLMDLKLDEVAKTNRLDLHDLSVAAAKECLGIALDHWWSDELYFRENNGDKLHLTKANHVGSLKVITGRGIHSAGGIPKVKNAVVRYLDAHKYVYDDNGSAFIVKGKKR